MDLKQLMKCALFFWLSLLTILVNAQTEDVENLDEYYSLRYKWEVENFDKQKRILLFETAICMTIPGSCNVRIKVLDAENNVLSVTPFSVGWRTMLTDVSVKKIAEFDFSVIEVITCSVWQPKNTKDFGQERQYYALLKDEVILIRYDAGEGKSLVKNMYAFHNVRVGPGIPKRTEQEWEEALLSNNPIELLRALTWLRGVHAGRERSVNSKDETQEATKLVQRIQKRPAVQKIIEMLQQSSNSWVREAAQDALTIQCYE